MTRKYKVRNNFKKHTVFFIFYDYGKYNAQLKSGKYHFFIWNDRYLRGIVTIKQLATISNITQLKLIIWNLALFFRTQTTNVVATFRYSSSYHELSVRDQQKHGSNKITSATIISSAMGRKNTDGNPNANKNKNKNKNKNAKNKSKYQVIDEEVYDPGFTLDQKQGQTKVRNDSSEIMKHVKPIIFGYISNQSM